MGNDPGDDAAGILAVAHSRKRDITLIDQGDDQGAGFAREGTLMRAGAP